MKEGFHAVCHLASSITSASNTINYRERGKAGPKPLSSWRDGKRMEPAGTHSAAQSTELTAGHSPRAAPGEVQSRERHSTALRRRIAHRHERLANRSCSQQSGSSTRPRCGQPGRGSERRSAPQDAERGRSRLRHRPDPKGAPQLCPAARLLGSPRSAQPHLGAAGPEPQTHPARAAPAAAIRACAARCRTARRYRASAVSSAALYRAGAAARGR